MNPKIDDYLAVGCGRCPLGGTPNCNVHRWADELVTLRKIILDCGLTEECKWSVPCYTVQNKNVLILHAFKEYCGLSFFNGALLKDPANILSKPGENTQAGRIVRFTRVEDIEDLESTLKDYIQEAVEAEQKGLKVPMKKTEDFEVPIEFQNHLDQNPTLYAAFRSLSPGRQRAYLLHFSSAKQSQTREARILKQLPQILAGKGFNER